MSDDINRLRELAGINQEPVKPKTKQQLDEGVIGGMQEVRHVSIRDEEINEDAPPGMEDWIKSNKDRFKQQYGEDWEEVLYATAWKMKNDESVEESDMDSFANDVDEEVLVDKEQRIVDDAKSMIARGMDPDSVIMSLASEYNLSDEEQFDLYNVVVQDHSPVEEDEDQETMRGRQSWEQGDTEESHTVDWEEVRNAAADAAKTIFGNVDQSALDGIINDTKRDVDDYANTEDAVQIAINKMRQDEGVNEDFDNGYDKQVEVDADGYFPRGAHNAVDDDAGPSSAKHGDNPMQKKMDVNESKGIHQGLVSNYRLFKKS